MQRVPTVPFKVAPLRRGEHEAEESTLDDDRRDRVEPWPAVAPHRRQISETRPVLLQERPNLRGEARRRTGEAGPGHPWNRTHVHKATGHVYEIGTPEEDTAQDMECRHSRRKTNE